MTKRMVESGSQAKALLAWLQQREDELAALLAQLVAVPTENPPGKNYRACANVLENRLKQEGLDCDRLEVSGAKDGTGEVPVCLVAGSGRGERVLYFPGHYAGMPAQSPEQFQPIRRKHFLFCRGSCDMKGGIVAMFYAILALRECGVELGGRIVLMLFPDEETGGERGSAWISTQGRLSRSGRGMF